MRRPRERDPLAWCSTAHGPPWNEARAVLEQELKQPGVYFSILEQLATGAKEVERIASGARIENATVSRYLATLAELRIAPQAPRRRRPLQPAGHWELGDPFMRFWFRFVFPYQAELETGLRADDLWESAVNPALSDHVAPVFEESAATGHGRATDKRRSVSAAGGATPATTCAAPGSALPRRSTSSDSPAAVA